jgi:putative transposase
MSRTARIVIPDMPHHVIQRGNRRMPVFLREEDYALYLDLMREWCGREGVEIWAYCLMTNHVHLIAIPQSEKSLARAIGEANRRYTRAVNLREGWSGHLWQGRFSSYLMDESHTLQAARYIELNPVAAKLCKLPQDYRWSSARAHLRGEDDELVAAGPLLKMVNDWQEFLGQNASVDISSLIERHAVSGRPAGPDSFLDQIGETLGRSVKAPKRGRRWGRDE